MPKNVLHFYLLRLNLAESLISEHFCSSNMALSVLEALVKQE
jgi:hypothetical protein